jgi:hypothetical protein
MSRSSVRVLLGVVGILVLIAAATGAFVWWKISGLKERLVSEIGRALNARVQIASIELDPWKGELHVAGISLTNQKASAPWDKADISQATLRFDPHDVFATTLPITVDVSGWNIVFHSRAGTSEASFTGALPESIPSDSPNRVQVTKITAEQGTAEIDFSTDRKVFFHEVSFQADDNGAGVWTTQLQAGSLMAGSLDTGACSVQIRGEEDKISFASLRMQVEQGVLTGDGEVALSGQHDAHATLKAVDIPVTMLVATEWQMKLSGLVSGDLHFEGNDQGGDAKGRLSVNHGKFNVLPWMGKLTAMVGLQDITDVEVDQETTDYEWKDHTLHLTNLDVRKNDVTRITGTVDVDAKGQVDGKLKLGLPSYVTAKWPQMQTQVFPVQQDGFNWADVHLTGTSDHLQEDLSSRLLAAGMGQGTDLFNQAAKKATDLFNNFIGK